MRDLIDAANAVRRRHPTLNLDQLAHPPNNPCPPPCPRCGNRHRGAPPCPCRICHVRHKGACGPHDPQGPQRPGCLACRLADDTERAVSVADLGDGIRSPSLEPGGGGGGPASAKYADDDERGGVSTPVERAALNLDHRDALALADAAMYREHAIHYLRLALHTREDR